MDIFGRVFATLVNTLYHYNLLKARSVHIKFKIMSIEKDIKQKSFANPYQKLTVNMMFTNNWLVSEFSQIIKPYSLSEQQYSVLKILQLSYPIPLCINTIIENMRDQMSNVSRLVDKLEQKGFVERRKSPTDKRVVEVLITEEGLDVTNELNDLIEVWESQSIQMSQTELEQLETLLQKLQEDASLATKRYVSGE